MNQEFWALPRIAGGLLVASILVLLAGLVMIYLQGNISGLGTGFQGVAGKGAAASALVTLYRFSIPAVLLQLLGFGLLTILLREAGDRAIASPAFSLLIFSWAVATVEGSFQSSVTVWAAQEYARTGAVPELFEPLRRWVNDPIQRTYMIAYLVSMAGYGWAILRTQFLTPWVGWFSIGWSLTWTLLYLGPVGAPVVAVLFPLVFGGALLFAH